MQRRESWYPWEASRGINAVEIWELCTRSNGHGCSWRKGCMNRCRRNYPVLGSCVHIYYWLEDEKQMTTRFWCWELSRSFPKLAVWIVVHDLKRFQLDCHGALRFDWWGTWQSEQQQKASRKREGCRVWRVFQYGEEEYFINGIGQSNEKMWLFGPETTRNRLEESGKKFYNIFFEACPPELLPE